MLVLLVLAATLLVAPPPSVASAHTPHDDVFDVAISPAFGTDRSMLAIVRGIVVRSTDGGHSWNRIVNGLDFRAQPRAIAYAGGSGQHSYLVTADGVFRSVNGGGSWTRVRTSAARDLRGIATTTGSTEVAAVFGASGLILTTDGGASWRSAGASVPISAAAFKDKSTRFLIAGDSTGTIRTTSDGGTTWRSKSLAGSGAITSIALSPRFAVDLAALVGTSTAGLQRWDHASQTATPVTVGLTDPRVTSVAYSANFAYDRTVFVSNWTQGIYVSRDAGSTWTRSSTGLRTSSQASEPGYSDRPSFGHVQSVLVDPLYRTTVEALASFTGAYASTDKGTTWAHRSTLATSTITGLAVSPEFGSDGRVGVMTYVNAAAVSNDRGANWTSSNSGLEQRNYWYAAPDRYLRGFNLAYSPTVTSTQWIYVPSDPGVYRSSDGGQSWQLTPVPGFASPRLTTVPAVPRVFVLPSFATNRTVLMVDTVAGDVYRSRDAGASFTKVGVVPSSVRCLQASPRYSTDRRLFACTGKGVYVSTDAGTTWSPTQALPMYDLAVVAGSGGSEMWFAGTSSGLYRSTTKGASWTAVALPSPAGASAQIGAVAASPPSPQPATVLVSTKGKGMYRSTDGGVTFQAIASSLLAANEQFDTPSNRSSTPPIVFSPAYATDRTIFGASHDHVFRSTDGGVTWVRMAVPIATHTGPMPGT